MIVAAVLAFVLGASSADADAAYQAKQYERAAALYTDVVKVEPANAQAWYRLGVSDAALGKRGEARTALTHSLQLGYDAMSVHYRLAGVAAAGGDASSTVSELRSGLAARPFGPENYADDPAFAAVAKAPEFTAFVDEQNRKFHPCRYDNVYRALDFWIGDWVVSAQGGRAGTSRIEPAMDGCAILETWSGTYGDTGRSISSYDAARKVWVQHYVSGRALITDYDGRIAGGSVVFIARTAGGLQRMTYTKLVNGNVRQRFDFSKDGGKTWSPPSDLIYEKK